MRDSKGRWLPGQSANPAGPPKGYSRLAPLRDRIMGRVPEIIDTLIAQALAGDVQASRLLLERVFPALKPEAREVVIDLEADHTLTEQAKTILLVAARGEIPIDSAAHLLGAA